MQRSRACRSVLALGALLLVVSVPVPGRAGQAYVAVGAGTFSPAVLYLDPGDDVVFDWLGGTHHIAAYRNGDFDSGEQESPYRWGLPFSGGTIRYRCLVHSSLNAVAQCNGMCGILTDDASLDVQPPTGQITKPKRNEAVVAAPTVDAEPFMVRFPVRVEGTASDNKAVAGIAIRWYDNAGRSSERVADCPACGATPVTWSVEVSLLPGTYLVEAGIADPSGNRWVTPRTMFVVV